MDTSRVHIGTSGFSYKDWLGNFYPQFCPPQDFLTFYSSRFRTVEIDATFYRIPSEKTVTKWAEMTPDNFIFAAKFPRTVTHEGELPARLAEAERFVGVMRALAGKLGPLLLQFPYGFKPEQKELLGRLIEAMPGDIRISIELRNRAWLEHQDVFDLMKGKNIALCLIDHPWMPRLRTYTADFVYLRFLGDRKKIEEDFSYVRFDREDELGWWHTVIEEVSGEGRDLFAYFNNHYSGHAPSTAIRLLELIGADA